MTIRKRLARSNIAMLVIPILAAALLLLLGLGAALLLLRGNLMTLHDAVEQIESVLHGFKLTLVAFAKMDVSAYPVRLEPLALRPVLEAVTGEQEGVAVTVDVPDLTVLADRELLRRIAVNLLDNSRKYGGREDVHVHITAEKTGGMAAIAFADNGAGVPPEQLPRLFDVFYRGDAARTAPGNGSGIGLAVVKKSCDEMHGSVRAENGEIGGLRVIVTLPLAKEDANGENTDH